MPEFLWEDNLLERKVESDLKDLLKTLVAFANSVKPNHTAVILIGEKDDGVVQGVKDPDNIQKQIRKECDKIYPPIIWRSNVYEKDGKQGVRVEVENSGDTPHFGGQAWVRHGSETKVATDEVFQRLIDVRSGVVFELTKWRDKEVTISGDTASVPAVRNKGSMYGDKVTELFSHRWEREEIVKLIFVNQFWTTFERTEKGAKISEPLSKLTLSYDDKRDRLKIIVGY